jgi:phosphoglycerol transferase MdoB-like AlkP superfamily enzyme
VGNSNSKIAKYYGIDNYDDGASYFKDSDKDNVIGVYDAKFYPFVAQKISELQQPFFVTTENVSTHNPFNLVPKEYLKEHYKSEQEANAAFRYFDDAVAAFFSKIKNQPWFNNSVFIFIGDHCSRSKQLKEYKNDKTNKVALFIYEPGKNENGTSNTLCQQIDIGPSLLDKLNYRGKYFSFGKSIFSPGNRYVYFKDGGISQIRDESYLLNFDDVNDNVVSFKKYAPSLLKSDSLQMKDTLLKKMKAFIQKHNNLIVDNLITPN